MNPPVIHPAPQPSSGLRREIGLLGPLDDEADGHALLMSLRWSDLAPPEPALETLPEPMAWEAGIEDAAPPDVTRAADQPADHLADHMAAPPERRPLGLEIGVQVDDGEIDSWELPKPTPPPDGSLSPVLRDPPLVPAGDDGDLLEGLEKVIETRFHHPPPQITPVAAAPLASSSTGERRQPARIEERMVVATSAAAALRAMPTAESAPVRTPSRARPKLGLDDYTKNRRDGR